MGEKRTPLRKCIRCNEMKDKKELIRIVRNSDSDMNVDPVGKMPGRGAYICKDVKCFDAAAKAKRLEKAFKCKIPDEIYSSLRANIPQE